MQEVGTRADPAPDPGSDAAFARPSGIEGGFAPRSEPPTYLPPPPTTSPEERAVFGRPPGADAFAPAPGERIAARRTEYAPVPRMFAEAFGAPPERARGLRPRTGHAPRRPEGRPANRRGGSPTPRPTRGATRGRRSGSAGARSSPAVGPAQIDPDEDSAADERLRRGRRGRGGGARARPTTSAGSSSGCAACRSLLVVALVAGAIGGGVGWWLTEHGDDALHRPDVSIAKVESPVKRDPGSIADIAKRVGPAVVSIAIQTPNEFAIGSGVVIDKQGDILTNNHVVAAAVAASQSSIVVTFSNEATAKAQDRRPRPDERPRGASR